MKMSDSYLTLINNIINKLFRKRLVIDIPDKIKNRIMWYKRDDSYNMEDMLEDKEIYDFIKTAIINAAKEV